MNISTNTAAIAILQIEIIVAIILLRSDMHTSAIIMLLISTVFLWGGLIFAILHLMKHPEEQD